MSINATGMDLHEVITRMRLAQEVGIPTQHALDRSIIDGRDVREFQAYDEQRDEAAEEGGAAPNRPGIFKILGKAIGAGGGSFLGSELGGPPGGAAGSAAGGALGEELGGWIDGLDPIGALEDLRRWIHD